MKQQTLFKKRDLSRPFRNSGIAYKPKKQKKELAMQVRVAHHIRKYYPWVMFHSDFAANADLSEHQQKVNSSLQSRDKFPDLTIFALGRINPKTGRPYVGLALELKHEDGVKPFLKNGKLSTTEHIQGQAKALKKLNEAGWFATFTVGYDQSIKTIDWYFQRDQSELF